MTKPRTGAGKAPAPKRRDKRRDSDRESVKLTVRLPRMVAYQLGNLAESRGVARVAVLCDLIREASK